MLANYQLGSLVILHEKYIYDLKTPLQRGQVDKFSIGVNGNLHVSMKDGSELVLRPKSKEEERQYHAAHRLELCALQQRHAKKALMYSRMLLAAARGLVRVQNRMEDEAADIAGDDYEAHHIVSFELHGTNNAQIELDGLITTPDFASVLKMADELVKALEPVVTAVEPPPLLGEYEDDE